MAELDALIDSATRQVLPEDAKPRMVLRLMLAGWLRLETPPHAVIATGLPLLAGTASAVDARIRAIGADVSARRRVARG